MSISLSWHVIKPCQGHSLPGTSADWDTYQKVFGRRALSRRDCDVLRAMHMASGLEVSCWGALAAALETLPCGTEIEMRGEY